MRGINPWRLLYTATLPATAPTRGLRNGPAMASKVSSVGGFYSYISLGLGRDVGMAAGIAPVLVSEAEYETVRDLLEDERRQRGIRRAAWRNAIGRMGEMP